jgi:hypothetical protein
MRKLFFGISIFISCVSFAQNDIQTAVFPDGTEVDYQVVSNEIKDMERLNVFLEINTRSTLTLGPSVSYTLPEVFISKVHLGFVEKQFGNSKTKFIKYKTLSGSKPREHSKFGRTNVYAEMINYHAIKNIITDELDYDYSIIPSKAKTGFRIGLEGQSGNSKFGLSYFLGVETPLSKLFFIQPFGGVGVYFSFL